MKRIFLGIGAVAFIAVAAGVNARMNTSSESVSPLILENAEALAESETTISKPCPDTGGSCAVQVGPNISITSGYYKKQ